MICESDTVVLFHNIKENCLKTKVFESDKLKEGIIIDYGHDGKIVSMEILDASERVSEPHGIFYELKNKKDVVV